MGSAVQAKKPSTVVGAGNASGKLVGKDYITIAVFGLLMFLVFFAFSMVLGMNANAFWFTHAAGSLVAGIVWMYVAAKVPKRGAFAVMAVLVAVVALLLGMVWTGPAGIVVGGLAAEAIAGAGDKRTATRSIVAFAAFTLCFWVGQESMVVMAGQSYVDMVVEMGMSAEYDVGRFHEKPACFGCLGCNGGVSAYRRLDRLEAFLQALRPHRRVRAWLSE